MSDSHFTHADQSLQDEYKKYLDQVAVEMGRTNSRDDRVDWRAVNDKMRTWWEDKGFIFP